MRGRARRHSLHRRERSRCQLTELGPRDWRACTLSSSRPATSSFLSSFAHLRAVYSSTIYLARKRSATRHKRAPSIRRRQHMSASNATWRDPCERAARARPRPARSRRVAALEQRRVEHDLPDLPPQLPRTLTPNTEQSDPRHSRSGSGENPQALAKHSTGSEPATSPDRAPLADAEKPVTSFFGENITSSPTSSSPSPNAPAGGALTTAAEFRGRMSPPSLTGAAARAASPSYPDPKLSNFASRQQASPALPPQPHQQPPGDPAVSSGGQMPTVRASIPSTMSVQSRYSITPPPSIQAAAKPTSRPASPRPAPQPSHPSEVDPHERPPSPQFSAARDGAWLRTRR